MRITRRALSVLLGTSWALAAAGAAGAAQDDFATWLEGLRRDARARGIAGATLDAALGAVRPLPAVIEADRRQPERRMSFARYRELIVNPGRIGRGRELLARHRDLLGRVEGRYGVPGEVVVALWGLESSFGERQGSYPIFSALATLAHDGRRASLFRRELLSALEIVDRGDAEAERMQGSWAGAMGQNQFMPSTYLGYAVDFDGDGRRDIWRSLPDIFASTANYLDRSGWDARYRWGREVVAPAGAGGDSAGGLESSASLAEWDRRGVRLPDGGRLPDAPIEASLLRMDEGAGPSFLAYGNFRAFMAWNRSTYFGLSAGLLSDSLRDG